MSNLEAMSCGTAVVSTNVGGIPEIVQDGENGMLVSPNAPVELANAINSLLCNRSIRTEFSRKGRKWIEDNYSIEVAIKKLCRIYEEILS
jgi:starch synthase